MENITSLEMFAIFNHEGYLIDIAAKENDTFHIITRKLAILLQSSLVEEMERLQDVENSYDEHLMQSNAIDRDLLS